MERIGTLDKGTVLIQITVCKLRTFLYGFASTSLSTGNYISHRRRAVSFDGPLHPADFHSASVSSYLRPIQ